MFDSSRRQFILNLGATLAFAKVQPQRVGAQTLLANRTRLILLGTGGGPRPRKNSFASSQVIIVNNVAYVVDCGNGVAIQLARRRAFAYTSSRLYYSPTFRSQY